MIADGGCESSKTFLDSQIGPPAELARLLHGRGHCPAAWTLIGSLTGNEWGDLSFYIDNQIPVWVPDLGLRGRHRRERLVPHRRLRGHRLHRRQRARQVARGCCIESACPRPGTEVPGHQYCTAPGGSFTIDVTGEVRLVR